MPFFTGTKVTKKLPTIPACHTCKADRGCSHPKQTWGSSATPVVFVVPGVEDDIENSLPGGVYRQLRTLCERVGITLDSYAKIPAAACPGASQEAWRACQPLVGSELSRLAPKVIIPFGPKATQSVVGRYWRKPAELYDRWYGQQIPCRDLNAWICPVGIAAPHKKNNEVSSIWAYRWLRDAMKIQTRPWENGIVEPGSLVEVIYEPDKIREALEKIADTAEISAFDYETTGLKPEWDVQEVYTMSVAWPEGDTIRCIAFPTFTETHDSIRKYLQSPGKKVAANMKFEDRWSFSKFGVRVKNWFWDTMIAAHWENPIDGTTGLKFQAFAKLGIPYFAESVEGYFDSSTHSKRNRIHQAPIQDLLTYNGIDAIAELLVASVQMVDNEILSNHIVDTKYLPTRGQQSA